MTTPDTLTKRDQGEPQPLPPGAVHAPCWYWRSGVARNPLVEEAPGRARCPDCGVIGNIARAES